MKLNRGRITTTFFVIWSLIIGIMWNDAWIVGSSIGIGIPLILLSFSIFDD